MWKKLLKIVFWVPSAAIALFITTQTYISYTNSRGVPTLIRQEISMLKNNQIAFAAVPRVSFDIKTAYASQDARPLLIERYFQRYGSPMTGMEEFIVRVADENGVDPYLIIAIAQQESNLGKIMPPSCHNAWGWGIHSAGTLCFDTWEEGISTFTSGIATKYYSYGLRTPEEIMTKYNPGSPDGAWARGVTQFLDELNSGNF